MNNLKKLTLVMATIMATSISTVTLADDKYGVSASGDVIDDYVMYSIGGGSANGVPLTYTKPNSIGLGLEWNGNLICGNMDMMTTVQNQLNGVTNGFQQLMGEVINAATGAVQSLPAMLIQRANPGLYELLSNGVLQGRLDFDKSKLGCQALSEKMADVVYGTAFGNAADGFAMQDMLGAVDGSVSSVIGNGSGIDGVSAVEGVEKNLGENGLKWLGGTAAGGKNQPPIKIIADPVKAGYNAINGRDEADTSSISTNSCKGGAACTIWKSPEEATEFAQRVLGESERQTCRSDGCKTSNAKGGTGLTPLVQEEYEKRLEMMQALLSGSKPITAENLKEVSSDMLPVTRGVIEALKDDPDQNILAARIASETALSSVLEKAFMLLRIMQAGSKNPHIEEMKPVSMAVTDNIRHLKDEMEIIKMELDLRQTLANNTAKTVLERQAYNAATSKNIEANDPNKDRFNQLNTTKTDSKANGE